MDGLAPGATVSYTPPAWVVWQIVISSVLGLLILAGVVMVILRVRRHNARTTVAVR